MENPELISGNIHIPVINLKLQKLLKISNLI